MPAAVDHHDVENLVLLLLTNVELVAEHRER
jgi:hypothetical protein